MTWTARKKAIAFSTFLILISTAFFVTAGASTQDRIRPFITGQESANERSLSRGGVALAVGVGESADDEPSRVEGATVKVYRLSDDDRRGGELVGEDTTDERGVAVFQVRKGGYRVEVTVGDDSSSSDPLRVGRDTRIGVVFDEEGVGHWHRPVSHRDQERRGDVATVGVMVMQSDGDTRGPAAGATVNVYRAGRGDQRELVASNHTGRNGGTYFQLHVGHYGIEVIYNDQTQTQRVDVKDDMRVRFGFGPEGESRPHADEGRPHDRPQGDAPQHQEPVTLGVRGERTVAEGQTVPAANAGVAVYALDRNGHRSEHHPEPVASGHADEQGTIAFTLHPGPYEVVVTVQDGAHGAVSLRVFHDQRVVVTIP